MNTEGAGAKSRLLVADGWPITVVIAVLTGAGLAALALLTSPLLSFLTIAAVGAGILILRQPLIGVLLFVGIATLLPFAVFPVRVVFAPTLIDMTLTLLLLAWSLPTLRQRQPLVVTSMGGLLLLFVGLAVVSLVLGSGYAAVSAETFRLFLKLLNSMLLFFSVAQVVRTQSDLNRVIQSLIVGSALAAAIAFGIYVLPRDSAVGLLSALEPLGYPAGSDVLRTVAETDILRATGTSIDPNVLGGLLMLAIVITAAQLLTPTPSAALPRPLLLISLLVMIGAIGLTYSRGSWIGVAAGLVFLALFKDRRLWLALALATAALLLVPQGQAMLARLVSGLEARDPAAAMRFGEYTNALTIIAEYPFLGIGFGDAPHIGVGVGVSNVYLLIAEEMGLVGLAVFLAIVLGTLGRSFLVALTREGGAWAAHAGLQAALVAALVAGLFDHYFFNIRFPHMVGLFWLLVALLVVSTRLGKARPLRQEEADVRA